MKQKFVDDVMAAVAGQFREWNHHPSKQMMEALSDIPFTVHEIIHGEAAAKAFISPLDTGVGKTTTLANTLFYLRSPDSRWYNDELGILICVNRYDQIEHLIEDLELGQHEYAILVSDSGDGRRLRTLGVGVENANNAQLLFTTHAMVESRVQRAKRWSDLEEFYYRNQPRKLKVWDEKFQPGLVLTIGTDDLALLIGYFSRHKAFGPIVQRLYDDVRSAKDQGTVYIPDFEYDVSLPQLRACLTKRQRDEIGDILAMLFRFSGRTGRVRHDGNGVYSAVNYTITFPNDFYPALVLDACARVSPFYEIYGDAHKKAERLRAPEKRYDNVAIHFQEKGWAKESFGLAYEARLNEVAEIIRQHPDRKVLVLHHKENRRFKIGNVEEDLFGILYSKPRIGSKRYDVSFCSWGKHNATNDFADCNLIITASVFFPPTSFVEGRARLAKDLPAEADLHKLDFRRVRLGEIKGELLQALSRGSMRKLEGDQAKECLVYMSAAKNSGVYHELKSLFPGATIMDGWGEKAEPMKKNGKLSNQQEQAILFIEKRFAMAAERVLFQEIIDHLAIDKGSFSKRIVNHPAFQERMKELGWYVSIQHDGRYRAIQRKEF